MVYDTSSVHSTPTTATATAIPTTATAAAVGNESDAVDWAWQHDIAIQDKTVANPGVLRLRTNLPSAQTDVVGQIDLVYPPNAIHVSPGVLRSCLQKNIRRGLDGPAVRTAACLGRVDYTSLIRRMPVIMIEDVMLHPALPIVTWLMLSNHCRTGATYVPPAALFRFLLASVGELASMQIQDREAIDWKRRIALPPNERTYIPNRYDLDTLPSHMSIYLRCLLIRSEYGGLGGDIRMLQTATAVWYKRFNTPGDTNAHSGGQGCLLPWYLEKTQTQCSSNSVRGETQGTSEMRRGLIGIEGARSRLMDSLKRKVVPADLLPAGFDFHCKPDMINELLAIRHRNHHDLKEMHKKKSRRVEESNVGLSILAERSDTSSFSM